MNIIFLKYLFCRRKFVLIANLFQRRLVVRFEVDDRLSMYQHNSRACVRVLPAHPLLTLVTRTLDAPEGARDDASRVITFGRFMRFSGRLCE